MHRTLRNRRKIRVLSPALAVVLAFAFAVPAYAQTGRFAVLVPAFRPSDGAKENFGKDVAKEVNKLLEQFPTHTPVDSKKLKDALKQYGLKEDALTERDCVPGIQLAIQIDIQLVMCGTYEGADGSYTVHNKIIAAAEQNTYEMKPFAASDPKQAAQTIMQEFQGFLDGLKVEVYCSDYTSNQDWPSAIEQCRKAIDLNPNSRGAAYNLGSALRATGDTAGARTMFKKVLDADPLNQDALLSLGVLEAQSGNTEAAMGYFREYLNLDPNNVDVRITVATQAAQEGGNEAALQIIEDGLANATPENKIKLMEYAGAFAMNAALKQMEASGDMTQIGPARPIVEKGLDYLNQVYQTRKDSMDVTGMRNMLTAYRLLDRTDDAIAFGKQATQHYPQDAALWSTYADALNKAGQMQEALAALDRIAQIDPNYTPLYARKASWLIDADNLQGAVDAIKKGQQSGEINDQNADVLAQKIAVGGFKKAQAGQLSAATPYYDAAAQVAIQESTKGMLSFFRGYSLYQQAVEKEKPETLATAKATLPLFQQAQQLMAAASAYTKAVQATQPNLEQSRNQILGAIQQYIDIQEALIKRGK
jgi:tetratricopeptide (TPR) repeat protein